MSIRRRALVESYPAVGRSTTTATPPHNGVSLLLVTFIIGGQQILYNYMIICNTMRNYIIHRYCHNIKCENGITHPSLGRGGEGVEIMFVDLD